jgi:hypothetical protein
MAVPKTLEEFFEWKDGRYSTLLRLAHQLLLQIIPEFDVKFQWAGPHYYYKGHILYLNFDSKSASIYLSFIRGTELSNESGALVGEGQTSFVRKLFIHSLAELDGKRDLIRATVMEAIILAEAGPGPWQSIMDKKKSAKSALKAGQQK